MSEHATTVTWTLNGKQVESPPGLTIMEAAKLHDLEIPNFCYHPGLSIAGNCRICFVESNRSPKPVISCSERIAEGLEIQTHSEMALEARNSVMEFQLITHPLDCPVCDKAGECVLQDHSYTHGPDRSRFEENKTIRHTKKLGSTISIWGNRCIVCTRCVRFCDEITGTGELCVVERGDRSVVDVFPGLPIENSLAGNVIDICPVGALIGEDFKFEARIWDMKKTSSVCAGCSRGCNIEVQSLDGFAKRIVARENPEVNEWWICDRGRYDYRYLLAADRVTDASAGGEPIDSDTADSSLNDLVSENGGIVGILVDPMMTCEELHLVNRLSSTLSDCQVAAWSTADGEAESFPNGFTISSDLHPNRAGVGAIIGKDAFSTVAKGLRRSLDAGDIDLLIVFAGFPHPDLEKKWIESIGKAKVRIVFSLQSGSWCEGADLLLPSTAPLEKEGSYLNQDGRLQRVRTLIAAGQQPFPSELVRLQALLTHLGERPRSVSSSGVFRELASSVEAFSDQSHSTLGESGCVLSSGKSAVGSMGGDA